MDIVFTILIIAFGLMFINRFKTKLTNNELLNLKKLWFYHLLFGIYYCFFIVGDAIGYWKNSKTLTWEEFTHIIIAEKGTAFMYAVNYVPASVLNLSYFANTMLFTLIGFIGLTYFYVLTVQLIPYNSKFKKINLFPLLFFLPNLHFWSVGVGKDTILFFCIGAICYGFYYRKYFLLVISLLLVFGVRPHMLLFIVLAYGSVLLLNSRISLFSKLFIGIVIVGVIISVMPSVMKSGKIDEITMNVEAFSNFTERKAKLLSRSYTDSRVDISSYSLPLKVFTFLFRPLFIDINGFPSILASFENLLLLLLTFKVMFKRPLKAYKAAPLIIKCLIILLLIGTFIFSQALGNLGIMLRMRNMFLPGMFMFILWVFSYEKNIKYQHKLNNK